jgi:aryl-alcohol dehydrogenase-like predicted oxidoreductase
MRGVEFAIMQFIAEKNGWTKFVSMQNQYNLLYREEEREMDFFCGNTGLIPYSPFCPGHLARSPSEHRDSVQGGLEFAHGALRATGTQNTTNLLSREWKKSQRREVGA